MKWKKSRIELGDIKEGSVVKMYYYSLSPLEIDSFRAGCTGCTIIGKYKDNKVQVTYKPGEIPKHFIARGRRNQYVTKTITVTYKDGSTEILHFTANIIK